MLNLNVVTFKSVTKKYNLSQSKFTRIKDIFFNPIKYFKSKTNKSILVLDDISFDFKQGDCLGVIGRNGSGKSTTLGLMTGILKPTHGEIQIIGKVAAMLELGSGFHPDLSGRDNIYLNAILHGLTKKQVDKKIQDIIDFSSLGMFIDEPVRIYSSGMLAKLGFSIIINVEADILIIDEVLAVGDAEFQKKCWCEINKIRRDGVSIILVSHNIHDVKQLCNRVIWIEDGKIKMNGDVEKITALYEAS